MELHISFVILRHSDQDEAARLAIQAVTGMSQAEATPAPTCLRRQPADGGAILDLRFHVRNVRRGSEHVLDEAESRLWDLLHEHWIPYTLGRGGQCDHEAILCDRRLRHARILGARILNISLVGNGTHEHKTSSSSPSTSITNAEPRSLSRLTAWRRQLPYAVALILTLIGVAYTSYSKRPIVGNWELLTVVMAVLCVSTGWRRVQDREGHLRLIWTQTLHWLAFLVAMNLVLLTSMQTMLNADALGLAILMLPALGTFVAESTSKLGKCARSALSWLFPCQRSPGSSSRHFCC